MISDYPFLANLAVGQDRVIPQDGDNQVVIPSVLSPIIVPRLEAVARNNAADQANISRIIDFPLTKLNVPAAFDTILVLPKGYYVLELSLSGRSNFVPPAGSLDDKISLILQYQGFDLAIASLFLNVDVFALNVQRTFLLTSQALLRTLSPPTNDVATNSVSFHVGGIVSRII